LAGKTVADAVSHFGASVKPKLTNVAISGAPEDQLRGPLETLVRELAEAGGLPAGSVDLVGETTQSDLKTRPDYAAIVSKALVGFIEVKAPGKGADPRKFSEPHDREQWDKLKSLPNLLYTDGNSFSLWRDGKPEGAIVHLDGDVESSGAKLAAPATLLPLISDFLRWSPIPPKTAKQLAQISARLCRLLRDEVVEQMERGSPALTGLAQDWRKLLFPQADDAQFADGYAQAVTFGLLVARARDISLAHGTEAAAQELRKSNSLIGTALSPFAVAQLRLIAELQALMSKPPLPELRLFITNTLGNPFIEEEKLGQTYEPIAVSRRAANKVKKEERITVVLGNPPYKNQAGGLGEWIESGSGGRATPMSRWAPPPEWGVGAHSHHLKNLYVYFWRWATLKVFGSGWQDATGQPDEDRYGIVCFITVAGFLNGPGFQKMREDLRRDASEIWVIDCSPEGHQPNVPTRIFEAVQQPVCIVLAARAPNKDRAKPARLRYVTLPKGKREKKFEALGDLSIGGAGWEDGASGWREPFLPEQTGAWATCPPLMDFFMWSGPGVTPHRTWPISPDVVTLERRWDLLRKQKDADEKQRLFHPDRDRYLAG
jgi:hypothetical protein